MSSIFGICKAQNDPELGIYLARMARATQQYAPDGTFVKVTERVAMGFQPYHTDEYSKLEEQPCSNDQDDMVAFDGRLDNRNDLRAQLDLQSQHTSDPSIVVAAFQHWGEGCFSRFIGDWALALWSPRENALYLARDHAGTRNIYYEIVGETIVWGTYLETFLADGRVRDLDRAYATRYLAAEPTRDSTPYAGIRSVTPAHYLEARGRDVRQRPHWSPKARGKIHYRRDKEYADHFLLLFKQAVMRRTGSGAPILAELSGGMDSSAIVCTSDQVRMQEGAAPSDLLDTVSYYDDSEPDWDEEPFFTAVERQRGKTGLHIDVFGTEHSYESPDPAYLLPGADASSLSREHAFENQIQNGGYRVILSGIGGDELLGGPPNPLPELADYVLEGRFGTLFSQAFSWSLASKSPLFFTLANTAAFVGKIYLSPSWRWNHYPRWIFDSERIQTRSLEPEDLRNPALGHSPSTLDNCVTWWNMLETLPHRFHTLLHRREYRYPYLDRDLVDFLLRVPRQRLLKPGRRRFLMRNALRGIVPVEILERKRKAFVTRSSILRISRDQETIASLFENSELGRTDLVDIHRLRSAIQEMDSQSASAWIAPMLRAVQLELWLRRDGGTRVSSEFALVSSRPSVSAVRPDHSIFLPRRKSARKGGELHDQEV